MRTLTRNEKVLGGLFLALAVGLVLILLATNARRWVQQGQTATREVQARIAEAQQWISETPTWNARADWLRANPLPLWQEDASEAELIQSLQASLAKEGLTINSQRLVAATDQPNRAEIGVELSIKGTTTQMVRWLHGLQQPGEFITIRQINLRADPDKTNLRADVSLVRHYATTPPEETATPPAENPLEPDAPTPEISEPTPESSPGPDSDPTQADPTLPASALPVDPAPGNSLPVDQPALVPEPVSEHISADPNVPELAPDITPLPAPDSLPPDIQP